MKASEVVEYHMVLNREQLRIVAAGLNELPYKVAVPLLAELQRQVDEETSRQTHDAAECAPVEAAQPPLNKGFVKQPGD